MNTTTPIDPVTTISPYMPQPQQAGWVCPVCNAGVAPWMDRCPCNYALPYNPGQPRPGQSPAPYYPWQPYTTWCGENTIPNNYDGQGNTPMDALEGYMASEVVRVDDEDGMGFVTHVTYKDAPAC